GADQGNRAPECGGDRLDSLERRRLAAAHDGEGAVDRTRFAAGYRRVDEAEPAFGGDRGELARDFGRSRGVVDVDRARLHAGKRAFQIGRAPWRGRAWRSGRA